MSRSCRTPLRACHAPVTSTAQEIAATFRQSLPPDRVALRRTPRRVRVLPSPGDTYETHLPPTARPPARGGRGGSRTAGTPHRRTTGESCSGHRTRRRHGLRRHHGDRLLLHEDPQLVGVPPALRPRRRLLDHRARHPYGLRLHRLGQADRSSGRCERPESHLQQRLGHLGQQRRQELRPGHREHHRQGRSRGAQRPVYGYGTGGAGSRRAEHRIRLLRDVERRLVHRQPALPPARRSLDDGPGCRYGGGLHRLGAADRGPGQRHRPPGHVQQRQRGLGQQQRQRLHPPGRAHHREGPQGDRHGQGSLRRRGTGHRGALRAHGGEGRGRRGVRPGELGTLHRRPGRDEVSGHADRRHEGHLRHRCRLDRLRRHRT